METLTKQIADNVKTYCRAAGIKIRELCEDIGVVRLYFSRGVSNNYRLHIDNVAAVADYFGMTLDALVYGDEETLKTLEVCSLIRKETLKGKMKWTKMRCDYKGKQYEVSKKAIVISDGEDFQAYRREKVTHFYDTTYNIVKGFSE